MKTIMLLILREISIILFSVKISIGQIAYLNTLISEYIEMRKTLFPDVPLRWKHHYLTHYPYLITKFGPLKHFWTLRFESKHQYFKTILKRTPNLKNVLHTLSEKHQLLQALHSSQSDLFNTKIVADEAVLCSNTEKEISDLTKECIFSKKFVNKKAIFRGITYTAGMYLCTKKTQYGNFLLCKVKHILINGIYNDLFFIGDSVEIEFVENKGLYEKRSELTTETEKVYFKDLLSHEPLLVTLVDNIIYFAFKAAPFQIL